MLPMRAIPLLLTLTLLGCVRSSSPPQAPPEDDRSVVFPQFFEADAVAVAAQGKLYALDGETLRAITIAAHDFLPPDPQHASCRSRPEAYFYRVIRQEKIIFIYIYENHAYCGRRYPAPDSGAKYAISTDGRILRRVLDGHPLGPLDPGGASDASSGGFRAEPGTSPAFDALWNTPIPDGGHPESP